MSESRGITVHFNDGSKMTMQFPKQAPNETAALMKMDDVLKKRAELLEKKEPAKK